MTVRVKVPPGSASLCWLMVGGTAVPTGSCSTETLLGTPGMSRMLWMERCHGTETFSSLFVVSAASEEGWIHW